MPDKLADTFEAMLSQTSSPFDTSLVLRAKGFIWIASFHSVQGDFSLAGNHFSLVPGNPWWAEIDSEHWPAGLEEALKPLWQEPFGDRQQEIVIIGQDLDQEAISHALDTCLCPDDDIDKGPDAWNEMYAETDPFYEDWYNEIEKLNGEAENGHGHDHNHHDHGHSHHN